jgi:hypothetical protein
MTRLGLIGTLGGTLLMTMACSSKNDTGGIGGGPGAVTGGNGNVLPTGGSGGKGGAGGQALPEHGLVPFDPSNDITALACNANEYEPEPTPVILQMVVDVSSSMSNVPPHTTTGQTKWEATRDALIASLDHLPAAAWLGVTFFPNMTTPIRPNGSPDPSVCIDQSNNLPITKLDQKDSAARQAIVARLNALTIPDNAGTPTDDAYHVAVPPLLDSQYAGIEKYILLITDGQPTFRTGCVGYGLSQYPVDPTPIIDDIGAALTDHQIKTIIIGSPGSEQVDVADGGTDARPWLSKAAVAGGTAYFQPGCSQTGGTPYCHFDMTTAADFGTALGKALQTITGSIAPCDYTVIPQQGTVIDPSLVNVIYTDSAQKKYGVIANQTTDCSLGWRFLDSTGTRIEICGDTCSYISNDPFAKMKVILGCKTIVNVN